MATIKPNILLIHCDQFRFDCLGVNGHPLKPTPNLDRLASQGVNYTHAYTPSPSCSPARASLQTGAWPTQHGCVTIANTEVDRPANPKLPVMTQLLADADYRVSHVGKFHREVKGGPTDHGAEVYVPAHHYKKWREEQGLPNQPRTHGLYGEIDPHITPEQTTLHWQADRVLEQLDVSRESGRPFMLRWDPAEPHLPNRVPEPYATMYPIDRIEPWPSFHDPLENKPEAQRRTRRRWGVDGWSWDEWEPIVQRYLGEITLLDAQVGRLLTYLDEHNLADDTMVIFTADHGDTCGGHGMIDKHYIMYDDVTRVPLIIRWPKDRDAVGLTASGFVSQEIDLAYTMLEMAGIEPPETFVGQSLYKVACEDRGRAFAFSQYQGTAQGLFSQRMLRSHRYKLVYNPTSIDELYDLESDPGEICNLIDSTEHRPILAELEEQLQQMMSEINDPLCGPGFDWGRSKLPDSHPAAMK